MCWGEEDRNRSRSRMDVSEGMEWVTDCEDGEGIVSVRENLSEERRDGDGLV